MKWEKSENCEELTKSNHLLVVYGTNLLANSLPLESILIPEELKYSERLKGNGQKATWLACRASLRLILATYLSEKPQNIELRIGHFGKLHVADTNLFFNISHTSHSFLLGFNLCGRIGVDIELLSGREDLPSLIQYAFSEEEAIYCKEGELAKRFAEIWTMKEAFLKAVGVGLVDELPLINVTNSDGNNVNQLRLNQKSFICPNGETGSIVYRKNQMVKAIWMI
ncbi:MAG: 4'-phosphopantetheinyl transferase superfamily protein [Prolixibacteraceae bacterium]|nr:4'-phosphopantetheinyl transferase superfamily protein [Prolixibacteraceae bacterium]